MALILSPFIANRPGPLSPFQLAAASASVAASVAHVESAVDERPLNIGRLSDHWVSGSRLDTISAPDNDMYQKARGDSSGCYPPLCLSSSS